MNTGHKPYAGWFQYIGIYAISFLICWGSLAALIRCGLRYVSILSWNLFGLEEMFRHYSGTAENLAGPASLIPVAVVAVIFTVTTWLVRSSKHRVIGVVVAAALATATLVWFPNPWENM